MYTIENHELKIGIEAKGAELQSIFAKTKNLEYMWSGDPAFWGKHSPLLFPIVGTLKDNTYFYEGKAYSLPRHGFARDRIFEVESQQADRICFVLKADAQTRAVYPFDFELRVIYRISPLRIWTTYQVLNPAKTPLYFSVGGHPAFRVPLVEGTAYSEYYLEFDGTEMAPRWPISKDGLIMTTPQPLLEDTAVIPLRKELFAKDALVLKSLRSSGVSLRSRKSEEGVRMNFAGFPYLGIWAAPNADFVCIEPWCGIADSVDSNQQLVDKEGINRLEANAVFERTWELRLLSGK